MSAPLAQQSGDFFTGRRLVVDDQDIHAWNLQCCRCLARCQWQLEHDPGKDLRFCSGDIEPEAEPWRAATPPHEMHAKSAAGRGFDVNPALSSTLSGIMSFALEAEIRI